MQTTTVRTPETDALTGAQTDALDREGYVVVPDAIDTPWLEHLRRAFDKAPSQADGTQHVKVLPETTEYDAWSALARHPIVLAAVAHVLRRPFRVRDLHGRNPLPGYGQQGLHADWMHREPGAPYFVVTVIGMIDEFTHDNGATRVVPGSHRVTRAIPKALAQPLAQHPEERVVVGRAGSLLIFNGHLWHSGRRNESRGTRRASQMSFVDLVDPEAG